MVLVGHSKSCARTEVEACWVRNSALGTHISIFNLDVSSQVIVLWMRKYRSTAKASFVMTRAMIGAVDQVMAIEESAT